MGFTFVHAADIHLDSPLRGLERYDGAPVDRIRDATRQAFSNLVRFCLESRAAFLLLAGDLYDGSWRDYNTGLFFLKEMARLKDAGIRAYVVRGNHDAQSAMTRTLRDLDNMHTFAAKAPETQRLEPFDVAIHGQSYDDREVNDDLSAAYPPPVPGAFNLGLLHTSADGRSAEHARYAPCSIQGLVDKGYDYWALGHIHAREVIARDPWIVFPGNLQGRHIREAGPKGATVVTVENGKAIAEHRDFDVVRWHRLEVPVDAAPTPDAAIDAVHGALSSLRGLDPERLLAVRIVLTGAAEAHAGLVANPEHWTNEARVRGSEIEDLWVEKVRLETRARIDFEALRRRPDPLGELLRTIDDCRRDPEAVTGLVAALRPVFDKLPNDLREGPDALRLDQPEAVLGFLGDVEQLLVPRLLESEEAA